MIKAWKVRKDIPGKESEGRHLGWGKNDVWDGSELAVTEGWVLEIGQSRFTSQLPLDELGDHDFPESPFFTCKKGRNSRNLLRLYGEE